MLDGVERKLRQKGNFVSLQNLFSSKEARSH